MRKVNFEKVSVSMGMVGDKPIYTVYFPDNNYIVYDGKFTARRLVKMGRISSFSIMHGRYTSLRVKIMIAIRDFLQQQKQML